MDSARSALLIMDGHPEISPRNRRFARLAQTDALVEGRSSNLHPGLAPQSGDVVLTKRRLREKGGGMFARQVIKPPTGPRVAGAPRLRVNVRGPGGTLYVRSPQGEV